MKQLTKWQAEDGTEFNSVRECKSYESRANNAWLPIDELNDSTYEGYCFIVYKGRVTEAYRDPNYTYRFHRLSMDCFMKECITDVMLWPMPIAPLAA